MYVFFGTPHLSSRFSTSLNESANSLVECIQLECIQLECIQLECIQPFADDNKISAFNLCLDCYVGFAHRFEMSFTFVDVARD